MTIQQLYAQWCKETKRNGSVLVGGSIQEFFTWLDNRSHTIASGWAIRDDEEVRKAQIKGYKYLIP